MQTIKEGANSTGTHIRLGLHVGPCIDQQPNALGVAFLSGTHQSRCSVLPVKLTFAADIQSREVIARLVRRPVGTLARAPAVTRLARGELGAQLVLAAAARQAATHVGRIEAEEFGHVLVEVGRKAKLNVIV